MTLKPGAKRERRPTIQVPPMSAGPRKAPTKKKAKKPPVKVPVPILVLVPESDSDDDMPLQARPMQQLPENQTIRETALVQIAPNLHHFGDELFREMIANFRRGVAEKSNNQQHFITTPHYNLAQFPITANFTACTGYNGTDQRITCCKMFDNTGIIHMEARTQRKLSTSVKYAIVSES